MEIRKADEEDIEDLVRLKEKLFKLHVSIDKYYTPNKNFKQMYRDHLKTVIASDQHIVFVARLDEKIAGFIEGSIYKRSEFMKENIIGSVYEIFVDDEYRKLGIGKQLTEKLLKWFKQKKIKTVEVVSDVRNPDVFNLWKGVGFKEYLKTLKIKI